MFFAVVEYPLLQTVFLVYPGLVSFYCFWPDVYFSLWVSFLVMIGPYVLLESPRSVDNISLH